MDEVLVMSNSTNLFLAKYYVHDHLYSPAALINAFGNVSKRYEYDADGLIAEALAIIQLLSGG